EFFAPERHAAIAAVAGPNIDLCFVEKLHGVLAMPAEAVRQPEELQKSGHSGFGTRLFRPSVWYSLCKRGE
ncbi:MAG TPA: hypothetical protein VM910_39975, partial [Bradyrhizobium sp.]|nr:hypothetical protein [Bradyrhizobium sp.]